MSWLIAQLLPWMLLSALLGFVSTVLMSTRRVTVERVVELPVEVVPVAEVLAVEDDEPAPDRGPLPVVDSPFPSLPGAEERPWEAEEEWSRPGRHRRTATPTPTADFAAPASGARDEWDDAAASWRDWAGEATGELGRIAAPDRGVASPFPPGAVDTPFRYDDVDPPFPHAQPVEPPSPFALARPEVVQRGPSEAERWEAERLEVERAAAARLERERLEAERAAAARLERERLEAERLEAERRAVERAEAERFERERLERERLEAERLETERLETERLETERLETERLETERLETERLETERLETERLETERLETERLETERLETERLETERLETERLETERADDLPLPSSPYGAGSAYAPFDGSAPLGYPVKGHEETQLFHTRQSRFYSRVRADVWFDSEASAIAAGFTRWDQRHSTAHHVRHPAAG